MATELEVIQKVVLGMHTIMKKLAKVAKNAKNLFRTKPIRF